jgi:hypothetical protein
VSFDDENLANELEKLLSRDYYFVEIKNKTRRAYNANMVEGDVSIRGEFIRTVLSLEGYTDEEKDKIISKGLKALSGREVDS